MGIRLKYEPIGAAAIASFAAGQGKARDRATERSMDAWEFDQAMRAREEQHQDRMNLAALRTSPYLDVMQNRLAIGNGYDELGELKSKRDMLDDEIDMIAQTTGGRFANKRAQMAYDSYNQKVQQIRKSVNSGQLTPREGIETELKVQQEFMDGFNHDRDILPEDQREGALTVDRNRQQQMVDGKRVDLGIAPLHMLSPEDLEKAKRTARPHDPEGAGGTWIADRNGNVTWSADPPKDDSEQVAVRERDAEERAAERERQNKMFDAERERQNKAREAMLDYYKTAMQPGPDGKAKSSEVALREAQEIGRIFGFNPDSMKPSVAGYQQGSDATATAGKPNWEKLTTSAQKASLAEQEIESAKAQLQQAQQEQGSTHQDRIPFSGGLSGRSASLQPQVDAAQARLTQAVEKARQADQEWADALSEVDIMPDDVVANPSQNANPEKVYRTRILDKASNEAGWRFLQWNPQTQLWDVVGT
jgi:hypothetical protein